MLSRNLIASLFLLLLVAGCAATEKTASDDKTPLSLESASFSDLPGWKDDDLKGFMQAYRTSCARILKQDASKKFASNAAWGTYGDWQPACRSAANVDASNTASVRAFVENNFKVMKATAGGNAKGLFTGYYESTLNGSRTKHGKYQHPLLGRPSDLVMVDLGDFRDELKGQRIAGRVTDGKLKPYENRAQIVGGKMAPQNFKPLVWLDDPHDAFFVQVQGSGIVHLDDGSIMRVGYAAQNGHPYYAIGRELVKRGIYSKDEVSMESIRSWMLNNPGQAEELMNTNPSYVFFQEMPDDGSGAGPQGGEGIKLTAKRSLAIDRSIIPYGFPVYLDADYKDETGKPIQRLMMAQDTGGAIRGAVRGDFFWGAGATAEKMAGPMKANGRYFFLMPK
ncbi:MAG: murein transglycosylase [Micavibrio aeruginosavorus]|uniref:peptidoglycan lytic exotransglycosylase n=1 Tax=Micavibrio aeruginosavorus TaxID=349221 RepID=A0A2W4ZMU1_9BACT|nr:MAG: murein transglycosylase [Micavibrio aeruginosavorus]